MAYRIEDKLGPLTQLCQQYGVRKLVLFGSALREDFDPQRSDLDFLVEFQVLPTGKYAKAYFGLLQDLEALFGRSVDLVEAGSIHNPYVQRAVEAHQKTLYAA
jgi:predicted nucleotidyltransferase